MRWAIMPMIASWSSVLTPIIWYLYEQDSPVIASAKVDINHYFIFGDTYFVGYFGRL